MAIAMRDAGIPADQASRFIQAGYVPLEGMLPFHADARKADLPGGPEWVALGGKRGPGKSHTAMAQVGIDDCQRVPDLKFLFLRKIQKSAKESLSDVIMRVFSFTPHSSNNDGVFFPNGSRILIGGYKDERDIDKYLGIEYDGMVIEECTQITGQRLQKLRGSLRTSKRNWRPRIYPTTNADGVGLGDFKKMFIVPARNKTETNTRFHDVSHIYNPFLNPEYNQWLDTLTGPLGKAWRQGDWDAFAGMAFPQWNNERHVVKPFDIPDYWVKWRATDWGYASPFCTLWLTRDPDTRRIYVYRELYQKQLTDRQQARAILELTPPNESIKMHYADPNSFWTSRNKESVVYTSADEYKAEGILLTKGDDNRIMGKRKVDNVLADLPDGLPGLQIFNTCPHLIDQMGNLASDPNNPEDVDTDAEDHAFDTLKYGLTNERRVEQPATASPKIVFSNPLAGTGL